MRIFLFMGVLLLVSFCGLAQQRQARIWKYGGGFGNTLDFGFTPMKRTKTRISYTLGVASICDSNGIYQFSGGSGSIANRKDSLMPQGDTQPLFGYAGYGCNLIIPYQKDSRRYHYFMISNRVGDPGGPPYFIYHFTINMELDGGRGDMDTSKTEIIDSIVGLQIACMLHANGRDSWLIARGYENDSLKAFLVTDSGVVQKVTTRINSPVNQPNLDYGFVIGSRYDSQLKSSPDSRLLFIPRRMKEYAYSELLQFDRETGVFSNRVVIPDTTGNFRVSNYGDGCFSPDGRKLYYSLGTTNQPDHHGDGPGHFWQYDISTYDSASIAQSKIFLGRLGRRLPNVAETWVWAPKMQLAMDGKIYISPGISTDKYMSTIRCPNSTGAACGLEFRTIDLGDGKNGAYFPTLNQTFVRNAGIFQVQANKRKLCQGDTLEMSGYGAGAEHFKWSVSPALPVFVKVDTLTWQKIPTQTIPPGSYTFTCRASSRCGDVYEKSLVVEVLPLPEKPRPAPALPPGEQGIVLCIGDTVQLSVADTLARYSWSTSDTTASIHIVPWNASGTHWFTLVTENRHGCRSLPSDSVAVTMKDVFPTPEPVLWSVPAVSDSGWVALCAGHSVSVTASGAHTYSWSDGNRNATRTLTGSGSLELYGYDTAGCVAKAGTEFRYKTFENPAPVILLQAPDDTTLTRETLTNQNYCVAGQPGSIFSFSVEGGTIVDSSEDCVTINWTSVPPSGARGPALVVAERLAGLGCEGVAVKQFSYHPQIQIPTLVTPNNDGANDRFVIEDLQFYASHHLQIFNRWGKKVLDTHHYQNDWPEPEGLYFYSLVVDGMEMKGWVEVMK